MTVSRDLGLKKRKYPFLVGGLANICEECLVWPFEYSKVQSQLSRKPAWQVFRQTFAAHGFAGFYRGLGTSIAMIPWSSAVRFQTFEVARSSLQHHTPHFSEFRVSLICGSTSGIVESVVSLCPMTSINARLIADQNTKKPRWRGIVRPIVDIVHEEGPRGLYRGLQPLLMKCMIIQAIRFSVYDELSRYCRQHRSYSGQSLPGWQSLGCGAVAGALSVPPSHGFDVMQTNMQGPKHHLYRNVFHCGRLILLEQGWRGLWTRGLGLRTIRVSLEVGLIFFFYELIGDILDHV